LNLALICSFFIFCSITNSVSNAEDNVLRRTVYRIVSDELDGVWKGAGEV